MLFKLIFSILKYFSNKYINPFVIEELYDAEEPNPNPIGNSEKIFIFKVIFNINSFNFSFSEIILNNVIIIFSKWVFLSLII